MRNIYTGQFLDVWPPLILNYLELLRVTIFGTYIPLISKPYHPSLSHESFKILHKLCKLAMQHSWEACTDKIYQHGGAFHLPVYWDNSWLQPDMKHIKNVCMCQQKSIGSPFSKQLSHSNYIKQHTVLTSTYSCNCQVIVCAVFISVCPFFSSNWLKCQILSLWLLAVALVGYVSTTILCQKL